MMYLLVCNVNCLHNNKNGIDLGSVQTYVEKQFSQ